MPFKFPRFIPSPGDRSHTALLLQLAVAFSIAGCSFFSDTDVIRLEKGLVIRRSVTIEPDTYYLPADSAGAIRVEGDGIEIDFNGATLNGSAPGLSPDEFNGAGIVISDSRNVTIRNATVRGYKVALHGTDVPSIHITDSDFSYNWRQRLKSTIERESQDDWMSYHNNESDEWLRYGAAVYLRGADSALVNNIRVTGGHNGIMLTGVNHGLFYNNEITFNSAIGIGLYRSSGNQIMHNRLDFNVRGHSPGVYNRGQDSAALLLYEQSSDNVIAFNSATHSGDGLFLWAGQSTMDSGEGGCNDNLIYMNDFSFAPTNGIEVTFSRNQIISNRIEGCWHGIWGGYSFDTLIKDNIFIDNDEHIAIEHGQDIQIERNVFTGGDMGIRLWERAEQPTDWGYSQNRDVSSRGYNLVDNEFRSVVEPYVISDTEDISYDTARTGSADIRDQILLPDSLAGAKMLTLPAGVRTGRDYMLIDQWGPYDFRSPAIWPRTDRSAQIQQFEILGPDSEWRVIEMHGIASISRSSGTHSATGAADILEIERDPNGAPEVVLRVEFTASNPQTFVDRFGTEIPSGMPFEYSYEYFSLPINWNVAFFAYTDATDPREALPAFQELIQGEPIYTESVTDLGYQWYREPAPGLPRDHFATVATGSFRVPPGNYDLDLTSDDGVRVWLDGRLLHDDWTYHAPRNEIIPVELGGEHQIRIEHFEIDGYATLIAAIRR